MKSLAPAAGRNLILERRARGRIYLSFTAEGWSVFRAAQGEPAQQHD